MWLILSALAWSGDLDGDAIDDAVDNCLYVNNADQADTNADGYGDACADPTATLGSNVVIARQVTISAGAVIGNDVVLLRRAYIGVDALVGDGAIIGGRLEDAALQGPARVLAQGLVIRGGVVASGAQVGLRAASRGEMREDSRLAADGVLGWRGVLGPMTRVGERSIVRGVVGSQSTLGSDVSTGSHSQIGHRVTLHDGVRIARLARIGDDSVVGAGAVLGPHSVLGERTQVGADARIRGRAELGNDVSVGEAAVLRQNTEVPAGVSITAGTLTGSRNIPASGSEVCVDGVDNDADSLVDCLDTDCESHFACAVETACADGQDNDYDGRIDCADRDCTGQADCPGESDCTDGLDNNNSGAADCSDPTCFGAPGCTVELLCHDGLDNDGDGYADVKSWENDFDPDPDCGPILEECIGPDLRDIDGDGLGWSLDPDCTPEVDDEVCNNGVDDNANGLIDCEDSECAAAVVCVENCVDGLDNDLDGDADCMDSDCLGEVCLAERRIPGGDVSIRDDVHHVARFDYLEGGGCVDRVRRSDWQGGTVSMDVDLDSVEVQLRVPTSMGAVSSSTCLVNRRAGGAAIGEVYMSGQNATANPAVVLVVDGRHNIPRGVTTGDCNWPDQAREAAFFAVENGAHFERDVGDQPVVLHGAGPWDLGEPLYWQPESTELDSETVSISQVENCWGIQAHSVSRQSADWSLPAQTHTFLPPEASP